MSKRREPGGVTPHTRPDGTIAYRVRLTIAGKRKSQGLFDTEEEAYRALAGTLALVGDTSLTLAAWGEQWLEQRETDGVHRDVARERSRWRVHVATAPFFRFPLRRIQPKHVREWVRALLRKTAQHRSVKLARKVSSQTAQRALALLRRCLADAVNLDKLETNPAAGIEVPRKPRTDDPWTWLTRDEVSAVLGLRLRAKQRALFTLAIYTGLREGELLGLRWCDVTLDGPRPELHVRFSFRGPTKRGKPRFVPLLKPAREALRAWRKRSPGVGEALVFPSKRTGGCHGKGYDGGWKKIRRRLQFGRVVRFHDLGRHTCASHLVQGTWTKRPLTLEQVKEWLGHSTVAMTERYAHLCPGALHDAIRDIPGTHPEPLTSENLE